MGGALLAHTIAGLLDGRRALTHPPCSFAPFTRPGDQDFALRGFYARADVGATGLLADDVRNTGKTFERARGWCATPAERSWPRWKSAIALRL